MHELFNSSKKSLEISVIKKSYTFNNNYYKIQYPQNVLMVL